MRQRCSNLVSWDYRRQPDECHGRTKSGVSMLGILGRSCAVLLRSRMQAGLVHAAEKPGSSRDRQKAKKGKGLTGEDGDTSGEGDCGATGAAGLGLGGDCGVTGAAGLGLGGDCGVTGVAGLGLGGDCGVTGAAGLGLGGTCGVTGVAELGLGGDCGVTGAAGLGLGGDCGVTGAAGLGLGGDCGVTGAAGLGLGGDCGVTGAAGLGLGGDWAAGAAGLGLEGDTGAGVAPEGLRAQGDSPIILSRRSTLFQRICSHAVCHCGPEPCSWMRNVSRLADRFHLAMITARSLTACPRGDWHTAGLFSQQHWGCGWGTHCEPGVVNNAPSVSSICVPGPPEHMGNSIVGPVVPNARVLQVGDEGVVECNVILICQLAASLTCRITAD